MKVSSKGQITIPLSIRQKLGILPNTSVQFVEDKGRIYIEKDISKDNERGKMLLESMSNIKINMSTEEIMRLTRS